MAEDTNGGHVVTSAKKPLWGGAFAAYGKVFSQIKKNPTPTLCFVGIYVLFSIISSTIQGTTSYLAQDHWPYEDLAYIVFLLALPVYGLALADRKPISVDEFMRFSFKKYVFIMGSSLLSVLIIGVSVLLLVVPAIWTIAWFFFVTYAVADKGLGPIQALKESKRLAKSHKAKVWGILGVSLLLLLPAWLLLYIPFVGIAGSAFVMILSTGAGATLYRWLQHDAAKTPA